MKKNILRRAVSVFCIVAIMGAFAACKKKTEETEPSFEDLPTSSMPVETTTTPTTTLTVYSGPLPSSDIQVTWQETQIDPQTMYAVVSDGEFLRVRKGPSTEYDIVGTLTRNQSVQIIAVTDSEWYKTEDGFYISATYMQSSPV